MGWYEDVRVAPPSISGGGGSAVSQAAALDESKFNSLQKGIKGFQDVLMQPYAMKQQALADAQRSNESMLNILGKQAEIDRKDKERTALAEYNQMLSNYSTSGIVDKASGDKLANEYNALLSSGKSEQQAGDIIAQRASSIEEADRKKLQSDPYAVAERLSGIAMPGEAGIDTKEMIGLRKELVGDYQKKGERKEDVDWRKYQFDETKRLQEKANAIAAGARADSLKLQREELEFKKQQLTKPELSAKQKEFKGNLALFGNDEEKAGIATFGSDDWKKIKGTYQDETKKKEFAVGGFKSDDILEKSRGILKTEETAQSDAAKTRTILENMQRAMQLPNSEMERIVPLIVDNDGEINKDALDNLYGNKITLDQSGNIIKMSDAFTKIANNPKDFVTVTNEGKTQLMPISSDLAKRTIKEMGPEAIDYYYGKKGLEETTKDMQKEIAGIKPSEPEKDAFEKKVENINKQTDIFGRPVASPEEVYNEAKEVALNIKEKIGEGNIQRFAENLRNDSLDINIQNKRQESIASKVNNNIELSPNEKDWINRMKKTEYGRFRLKELGIE